MKKLVNVVEVEGEGLAALLGENVLLMCANYFYAGKLTGVNANFVQLKDASIVYDTGAWTTKSYQDAQRLPAKFWYVQTSAIESYGVGK